MEPTQKAVLKKAYESGIIGAKHIQPENLMQGFHDTSKGERKKAMKTLIKKGYLVRYKTKHGESVYIPPCKVKEFGKYSNYPNFPFFIGVGMLKKVAVDYIVRRA